MHNPFEGVEIRVDEDTKDIHVSVYSSSCEAFKLVDADGDVPVKVTISSNLWDWVDLLEVIKQATTESRTR